MFLLFMRKFQIIFSLFMVTVLLLAGCDSSSSSSGNKAGSKYKEIETIELEGYIVKYGFFLDETGGILFWGEEDTVYSNNELGRYVWVDGDVESLDMDVYGTATALSDSGFLLNNVNDFNREPNHSLHQYNPKTGEDEEFLVGEDYDDLIHVGRGTYSEDANAYIHIVTNTDLEGVDTYIWNVETGEYTDLSIIQDLKDFVGGKLSLYPQLTLTNDLSTVYAIVENAGIFSYDVASSELE